MKPGDLLVLVYLLVVTWFDSHRPPGPEGGPDEVGTGNTAPKTEPVAPSMRSALVQSRRHGWAWWGVKLLIGMVALIGGSALGYSGLRPTRALDQPSVAIGFASATPVGVDIFADLDVVVRSCDAPVMVTLMIRPSAQTLSSYVDPSVKTLTKVAVALPGDVSDIATRPATFFESQHGFNSAVPSTTGYLPEVNSDPIHGEDLDLKTSRRFGAVVVSGTIRRWSIDRAPVVVTFDAPWLQRRSPGSLVRPDTGSCYLTLPNLTGPAADQANYQAARVIGTDDLGGGFPSITDGQVVVEAHGVSVDLGSSEPAPTFPGVGENTWSCQRVGLGDLQEEERGLRVTGPGVAGVSPDGVPTWTYLDGSSAGRAALPIAGYMDGGMNDCNATAVLVEGNVQSASQFALLLAGAMISLGLTVLVEVVLSGFPRKPASAV